MGCETRGTADVAAVEQVLHSPQYRETHLMNATVSVTVSAMLQAAFQRIYFVRKGWIVIRS